MRTVFTVSLLLSVVACAGPRYAERTPPPPPPPPQAAQLPPRQDLTPLPPVNDAATKAWLDREIEHNRYVAPPPPPVPAVERLADERQLGYQPADQDPYAYRPYYHYGAYGRSEPPGTTFPLHTALGAGVGAIIGHQSGHRSEGAWIGGGLGLLMDLGSHW